VSTAVFCCVSTVCQCLTLYRLLVLCHYVHCCHLPSLQCLSVPHTLPSVGSVSLCPLLFSTVCPLSVSTSHCTVCWFSDTVSTALLYSLSTMSVTHTLPSVGSVSLCRLLPYTVCPLCQYFTLNRLLVLCHCVHCCLLQSPQCLSVPHNFTVFWFSVTMTTAVFSSLSTVCQYLTLYRLLVLCHYVHFCLL